MTWVTVVSVNAFHFGLSASTMTRHKNCFWTFWPTKASQCGATNAAAAAIGVISHVAAYRRVMCLWTGLDPRKVGTTVLFGVSSVTEVTWCRRFRISGRFWRWTLAISTEARSPALCSKILDRDRRNTRFSHADRVSIFRYSLLKETPLEIVIIVTFALYRIHDFRLV